MFPGVLMAEDIDRAGDKWLGDTTIVYVHSGMLISLSPPYFPMNFFMVRIFHLMLVLLYI